ncbi:MAG: sigma-70 family RNA polymerase sigma factor [Actinobacteria bacterium]|nr:sigma-70 family RNA polymerase sigma factor [Actinomycetota bacterium]
MEVNFNLIPDDYFPLVKEIALKRYYKLLKFNIKHIQKEELENEGYFGLVKAIETFDPEKSKGNDFILYASWNISTAISAFLRNEDFLDHRKRKEVKELQKEAAELEQELGRVPTDEELSQRLRKNVKKIRELKSLSGLVEYLDEADVIQKSKIKGMSGLNHPVMEEPEKEKKKRDLGKDTALCLKKLQKEQMIIVLLKEYRGFTLKSVVKIMGQEYNISRVRRINERAKLLLRKCLGKKGWGIIDVSAIYDEE